MGGRGSMGEVHVEAPGQALRAGARLRSGPHRAARPMGRCTTAREPTQHAPSELHAGALFTCANDARREAHCAFGQGGARLPVSAIMLANTVFGFHEKTKFMAARLRVLYSEGDEI